VAYLKGPGKWCSHCSRQEREGRRASCQGQQGQQSQQAGDGSSLSGSSSCGSNGANRSQILIGLPFQSVLRAAASYRGLFQAWQSRSSQDGAVGCRTGGNGSSCSESEAGHLSVATVATATGRTCSDLPCSILF